VLKNIIICKKLKEYNNEKEYFTPDGKIYIRLKVYRIDIFGVDRLKTNNTRNSHRINITWSEFFFHFVTFRTLPFVVYYWAVGGPQIIRHTLVRVGVGKKIILFTQKLPPRTDVIVVG